jgi:CubicO group peptidase (beta-lactamase class C family)
MTIFSTPRRPASRAAAGWGLALGLFSLGSMAQPPAAPPAAALDPALLMQGMPPAPDYRVGLGNWQAYPQKIWSFQHSRELFPTRQIARAGPVSPLPAALRSFDALTVNAAGEPAMSWPQFLHATHTDAIVVLQHGRVVEEAYFNGMTPATAHLMFSASKSMTGLMAAVLIAEGKLDETALVGALIPELADSAWAGATVRQVLDMTDGVKFSELYTDPTSDVFRYVGAMGWAPQLRQPGTPEGILAMLPTLKAVHDEPRGSAFRYRSPATDVSAWIAGRAAGMSLSAWLEQRLWSKLGMEQDGYMLLDPSGQEVAFAGMNATPRDLARLGQLLLQRGRWNGRQLIPASVVDQLARGGDTGAFEAGGFKTRKGWSYRSQWWVNPNAPRSFAALGAFGQMLYVFPEHDVVIVKLSSHPNPLSAVTDPLHQRAFAAALALLASRAR